MLKRTFADGVKPTWIVGDTVYGCQKLHQWLEEQEQSYVLAVPSNYSFSIELNQYKAMDLLKTIKPSDWKKISVGKGTKGDRSYEWYRTQINSDCSEGWNRWLVIRRSIKNPEECAFYIGFSQNENSLEEMAKAAGSRWTIEECFEMAKGEVGLDHYEVRSWTGWYRHITFSLWALSYLVKLRTQFNQNEIKYVKKKKPQQPSMQKFLQGRG